MRLEMRIRKLFRNSSTRLQRMDAVILERDSMLSSLFFLLVTTNEARAIASIACGLVRDMNLIDPRVRAGTGSSMSGIGLMGLVMVARFLSSLCIDTVPAGLRRGGGTGRAWGCGDRMEF